MFNIFDTSSYVKTDEYRSLLERIEELENDLKVLTEKYQGALRDIKHLEEENIETTNVLYELMENIRAVDARIDIITAEKWSKDNV